MLKFVILAILSVPSIRAALSRTKMASALIAARNTGTLEKTFKKYEKEQDHLYLSYALADIAKVQVYMPKVAVCLRMAHDPFPKDKMCVCRLVHNSLFGMSNNTLYSPESFTNVITSFKPTDIKPLAAIRFRTLIRWDVVDTLKGVMIKFPALIRGDLPSWIAFHSLDRNSKHYNPGREESFRYLTSFATESVLEEALLIVKRNEHYKLDSQVVCCRSQDHFPQDLFNRINALLQFVKVEKHITPDSRNEDKAIMLEQLGKSTFNPDGSQGITPGGSFSVGSKIPDVNVLYSLDNLSRNYARNVASKYESARMQTKLYQQARRASLNSLFKGKVLVVFRADRLPLAKDALSKRKTFSLLASESTNTRPYYVSWYTDYFIAGEGTELVYFLSPPTAPVWDPIHFEDYKKYSAFREHRRSVGVATCPTVIPTIQTL